MLHDGNKEYQINKWKKIFLEKIKEYNPNDKIKCNSCKKTKKKKDFYSGIFKTNSGHDSLVIRKKCKECTRIESSHRKNLILSDKNIKRRNAYKNNWKFTILKSQYGTTKNQYDNLLNQNNGKCHICNKKLIKPYIDHCHKTFIVRGILCINCNTALGHFKDDITILKNAIKYLEKSVSGITLKSTK